VKLSHPDTDLTIEVQAEHAGTYMSQGWREASDDAPKGNASLEEWQDYARSKGFSDAELEGKSRDDLRSALS
jgi:hypothetical protein